MQALRSWLAAVTRKDVVTPVDEKELQELQDPDNWETIENDVREPSRPRRSVVSVSFPRNDFERVVERAQEQGMKTSEYIRCAVLAQVDPQDAGTAVVSVSGPVRTEYPPVRSRAPRAVARIGDEETPYTRDGRLTIVTESAISAR